MATQNNVNNNSTPLSTSAVTIDPGASGDSYIDLKINSIQKYRIGIDDTDSDAFVIAPSALGTSNLFRMSAAGEHTMPLQPSFLAYNTSNQTNVTGDGTAYTPISATTEVFDQNADYASSTFTAPVTGRYLFCYSLYTYNTAFVAFTANDCVIDIVTSNATYRTMKEDLTASQAFAGSNDAWVFFGSCIADMDATDTATLSIDYAGGGKTVSIYGSVSTGFRTPYFAGYLIC